MKKNAFLDLNWSQMYNAVHKIHPSDSMRIYVFLNICMFFRSKRLRSMAYEQFLIVLQNMR